MKYAITIKSAVVPSVTAGGGPWDGDGSPPDPYVEVYVDGVLKCFTSYKEATTSPVWNEVCQDVVLSPANSIKILIGDYDWVQNDTIEVVTWTDFAPVIHAGGYSGFLSTLKKSQISFMVTPKGY
jgi:hypothetical protein